MSTKKEAARFESAKRAQEAIAAARQHLGKGTMVSSAQLCLDDALAMLGRGEYDAAERRAARSLAYSIGICSNGLARR